MLFAVVLADVVVAVLLTAGEWREDMTAKVPTEDAPKELQEGVQVQLSNGLRAKVSEVTPEHVVIDANHELAGKDLTFDVELVQLQKVQHVLSLGDCLWLYIGSHVVTVLALLLRDYTSKHIGWGHCNQLSAQLLVIRQFHLNLVR